MGSLMDEESNIPAPGVDAVRRRASFVTLGAGGPSIILEELPAAEDWLWVTPEIAKPGMPVFMDYPPFARDMDLVSIPESSASRRASLGLCDSAPRRAGSGFTQAHSPHASPKLDSIKPLNGDLPGLGSDLASPGNHVLPDEHRFDSTAYPTSQKGQRSTLPAKLTFKIKGASELPSPSHGGAPDPYCELHMPSSRSAKARTRVMFNTNNPTWNEEFVFVINDSSSILIFEIMLKDVYKDESAGGCGIRAMELLLHNFYEPWSKDYRILDRNSHPTDSTLHLEFILEPVTLDFIRFKGDEGLGHLIEPMCEDMPDIWKVRWQETKEVGWYSTGYESTYHLRCAVRQSPAVILYRMSIGVRHFVRRSLRPEIKNVADSDYAELPESMAPTDSKGRRNKSGSFRLKTSTSAGPDNSEVGMWSGLRNKIKSVFGSSIDASGDDPVRMEEGAGVWQKRHQRRASLGNVSRSSSVSSRESPGGGSERGEKQGEDGEEGANHSEKTENQVMPVSAGSMGDDRTTGVGGDVNLPRHWERRRSSIGRELPPPPSPPKAAGQVSQEQVTSPNADGAPAKVTSASESPPTGAPVNHPFNPAVSDDPPIAGAAVLSEDSETQGVLFKMGMDRQSA